MPQVFVIGFPGDVGGANTELWHTLRLWRRAGLEVTLVPTTPPDATWIERVEAVGCRVAEGSVERPAEVSGLAGSVAVAFCNSGFLKHAHRLADAGCRLVWVNCMTWLFAEERRQYRRRGPFDAYVFQSEYQKHQLLPQLAKFGVRPEQCRRIRGACVVDELPFQPRGHAPGKPLVLGRISRAAADKYSARTWSIYGRVPHPVRARIMAWDRQVERKLGPPPGWAECLPAGTESPGRFLSSLHAMLQINGGAGENWPRSGLEAMACGVPIVAQNRWGWREMIAHGQTGYLAEGDDELVYYAARLAYDEPLRMEMAHRARRHLLVNLAEPERLWSAWKELFETLGA